MIIHQHLPTPSTRADDPPPIIRTSNDMRQLGPVANSWTQRRRHAGGRRGGHYMVLSARPAGKVEDVDACEDAAVRAQRGAADGMVRDSGLVRVAGNGVDGGLGRFDEGEEGSGERHCALVWVWELHQGEIQTDRCWKLINKQAGI